MESGGKVWRFFLGLGAVLFGFGFFLLPINLVNFKVAEVDVPSAPPYEIHNIGMGEVYLLNKRTGGVWKLTNLNDNGIVRKAWCRTQVEGESSKSYLCL